MSIAEDMRENHRAIRARLRGIKPVVVRDKPAQISVEKVAEAPLSIANEASPVNPHNSNILERAEAVVRLADEDQIYIEPADLVPSSPFPLTEIIVAVAEKHKLAAHDIKCHSRIPRLCAARLEYYYCAAVNTLVSLKRIGTYCGGRDHSTVLAGIRSYCRTHGKELPRGIAPVKGGGRPSVAGLRA